jgi:hypothetical protein
MVGEGGLLVTRRTLPALIGGDVAMTLFPFCRGHERLHRYSIEFLSQLA